MTTFRCDRIAAEALTPQYVSSNDPDTIGVELMFNGDILLDLCMSRDGEMTIMFDNAKGIEFLLPDFLQLVDRYKSKLEAWRTSLSVPGRIWAMDE